MNTTGTKYIQMWSKHKFVADNEWTGNSLSFNTRKKKTSLQKKREGEQGRQRIDSDTIKTKDILKWKQCYQ